MSARREVPAEPSPVFPSALAAKYWLGPYALLVATLYLWGYWGSFHVNVLEYISIADIIKAAVYPIVSAFAVFAIGAIIGDAISPKLNLPAGGGAHTVVGKLLRALAPFVIVSYLLGVTLYFFYGPITKWEHLPVLFAIAIYLPLKSTGVLQDDIKSEGARSIAVFLLATLVPFSYGRGALEAHAIRDGHAFSYVVSGLPGSQPASSADPSQRLRYIGKASERYAFFEPVAQTVWFVATSEVNVLVLKRYELKLTSAAAERGSDTTGPLGEQPESTSSRPKVGQ